MKVVKYIDDFFRRLPVQSARGLVAKDEGRVICHGPGDGDTLLLAAGKLIRIVVHPVLHADHFEELFRPLLPFPRGLSGIEEGYLDVRQSTHPGNEIIVLKNKADAEAADLRHGRILHGFDVFAQQGILPFRGLIQKADDVHEGRLARTGLADDGRKLPLPDIERYSVQDLQLVFGADIIFFDNILQMNDDIGRRLCLFGTLLRRCIRLRQSFFRLFSLRSFYGFFAQL